MFRQTFAVLAFVTLVLPSAAGAQGMDMSHGAMPGMSMSDGAKAMMDANTTMMQGMQMQSSGDVDKDFAVMMLPHHQGAVDMAKVELQYGKDPELRALAEKIVAAQEAEIIQLKAWLEKHK